MKRGGAPKNQQREQGEKKIKEDEGLKKEVGAGECMLCGRCNYRSEPYKHTNDERHTPRQMIWNIKKGKKSPFFYVFLLNERSECPININIDKNIIEARRKMVKEGLKTKNNLAVVQKLLKGKNPY